MNQSVSHYIIEEGAILTAKIIPFPTPVPIESPWEEVDGHIRAYLAEIKSDIFFIDYVANRMKDFIDKYASKSFEPIFNLIVPPNLSREQADALLLSVDKGMQGTIEEVQDMVRKIIVERLHLEIQVYESRKALNTSYLEVKKGYPFI